MKLPLPDARRQSQPGSTLVESLVSAAIASTAIVGLCVSDANCLGIARAHKEVLVADQCLQQRVEQCRTGQRTASTVVSLGGLLP